MSYFKRNGNKFYFEEIGEGKPLFFLHGLGGSIEQPKGILQKLDHVRLLMLDQRAHGKSEITEGSIVTFDAMADDVIALADYLNIKQFCVGGISMGASVAANIAYRYPDRIEKLFLVRAAWGVGDMEIEIKLWYQTLAQFLKGKDLEGYLKSEVFLTMQSIAPEAVSSYINAFEDPMALAYHRKFITIPQQCPYKKIENLGNIVAKTIVLSNKKDYIHKFQYGQLYMQYLKYATFHEIVPKAISEVAHKADVNAYISYYMNDESIGKDE